MDYEDLKAAAMDAMATDPLAEAERLTGKSYKDDEGTLGLGFMMHIANSQEKEKYLKSLGDTHFRMSWSEFTELMKMIGFETFERRRFRYEPLYRSDSATYPEFIAMAHRQKKLLLCATSWLGKSDGQETINGGTVYGTLAGQSNFTPDMWDALSGFSHGSIGELDKRDFSLDVREGMILSLTNLEEKVGPFVNWSRHGNYHSLWPFDYAETKFAENDDLTWEEKSARYKEMRLKFFDRCPDWVKEFIEND